MNHSLRARYPKNPYSSVLNHPDSLLVLAELVHSNQCLRGSERVAAPGTQTGEVLNNWVIL